jgi:urea carboxylase-associated protein 1
MSSHSRALMRCSGVVAGRRALDRDRAAGQLLRIVDLEGNQAVDTLFYNAHDTEERYSAVDTIRAQGNIYLTTGSALRSNLGATMLTIVEDTCGRHDTLGGACSAESNTVRYALEKRHMHSCRDNFLLALARTTAARQARSAEQHQFLHECTGDARRWPGRLRMAFRRPGATCSCARTWTCSC